MANLGRLALGMLGILAYQNRDKIGDLLRGAQGQGQAGGLGEILDRFRNAGASDRVDSWVGKGSNQPLDRQHVEQAIDGDTLDQLAQQTGLSREELIERITRDLPDAVDKMTPEGNMPREAETGREPSLLDDVPPVRQA